jgi:predicted transcriptional regulator
MPSKTATEPQALPRPGFISAYRPMAYPGVPGRWGRESILAALTAWVRETGTPPRRNDWCGENLGGATSAQRKWMREHPRWPSGSCVAAHFGTWSQALEAANLPARNLTFDSSVSERVRQAGRLAAAGWTLREIAAELDVSRSSVHNYLRARKCPDCGGPVTNRTATRCAGCAAREPTIKRTWTREAVREAIRDWLAEHGRAPSYRDWTPSRANPGRWEGESPRWPSAAVVSVLYADRPDPWDSALVDAGVGVRFHRSIQVEPLRATQPS